MRTDYLRPVIITGTCVALTLGCATGESDDGDPFLTLTTQNPTTSGDGDGDGDRDTGSDGHPEEDTGDTSPPDPACDDAEQNQMETDVDCGGPNCDACANGFACVMNSDCLSDSCVGNVCVEPSCMDGVQNGDETDVDCGGAACDPCEDNLGCAIAADCLSGVCSGGVCSPPACGDGVMNGGETDVDCGGTCPGCSEGEMCGMDLDCLSQFCDNNLCAPADCLVDNDCNAFDGACTNGVCNADKVCESSPINQNGPCDDGNLCTSGEVCSAGNCGGGVPLDCSQLSNACNVGVCNQNNGQCAQQSANDGNPCNDGNQCTVAEVCNIGSCVDPNAPGYVFFENFANNGAGWQLGTEWQIGAAAASNCADPCPGNDPATDHTPTGDNGIAGVVIGGCASVAIHTDYCITSPVVNTAAMNTVWLTYWRHLHTDYSPYMVSTVQVYNGNTWQQVYTTANVCVNDVGWTEVGHNVTAHKNANFRVRFCHNVGSGGAYNSGHWNIDDVTIGPAQCTPG